MALAQHTSSTSARRLQTSLVGPTSVLLNDANAGSSQRNWARQTKFSSCCTDRLELSSATPALDTD